MNAAKCASLQLTLLRILEPHPELGKLNGVELATVLNSTASTVTACVAGATVATSITNILAGDGS